MQDATDKSAGESRVDEVVLVTGAAGFVGVKLVERLLDMGVHHIRCLVRTTSDQRQLTRLAAVQPSNVHIELLEGNLLSREDCASAVRDASIVYHLATGRDSSSYPDAFLNAVVTTRNLVEAVLREPRLKRFVNVSSLAVYTNKNHAQPGVLDERSEVESQPAGRGDPYCYAKVKQDELVAEYGRQHRLPYVIVRPGFVIGPSKGVISSRVGIGTFGIFLHLGGSNHMPFTYVDNCADAIARAGLTEGIEGEVYNIVDDDLPTSRRFLREYKRAVRRFPSIYVPGWASYLLCVAWERYSSWSLGQLPSTFNRRHWHVFWKGTTFSNARAKARLGWAPRVPMNEALASCFAGYKASSDNA